MSFLAFPCLLTCFVLLGGNPDPPRTDAPRISEDIGEILAVVNGVQVGSKEFEKAAARIVPKEGDTLSAEERMEVIEKLIADKLLLEVALKRGYDEDPKVRKVIVNTLLREDVYSRVRNSDFTDQVLEAYFNAHPAEFVIPEKVQIKMILVKVTEDRPENLAKALAEKARQELGPSPKETFKDVAMKYSEDAYRRRGGDAGFVAADGKPGLNPELVRRAFSMQVGQVSPVFKAPEGFYILFLANRREKVERTFEQMKGSVLRKVKSERAKKLYDEYVANIEKGAAIRIDKDRLQAIKLTHVARDADIVAPDILERLDDPEELEEDEP